jgi:hypothetical protein
MALMGNAQAIRQAKDCSQNNTATEVREATDMPLAGQQRFGVAHAGNRQ